MATVGKTTIAALVAVLLSSGLLLGACSSDNDAARMARAAQYVDSGEYRSASIELKNVLQNQPENARAWFTLGRVSLINGQYADAAHQFRRARHFGAQQSNIDRLLAQALIGEGSFKEALEVLHPEAAGDSGSRAEMYALQGRAYLGLEKEQQARQAFEAALAATPDYSAALVGLARMAWLAGEGERARKLVERATSSDPTNGRAWVVASSLAFSHARCGDVVELFNQIEALGATALVPAEVFLARAHAAQCQLQQGQFEQAAANIDILMKAGPDHPYANYLKAWLAFQNKNYDDATAHVQKALAAAPNSTPGVILLGMIKAAQGDLKAAQFRFTEALTRAPDNLRARQLLASVYIRRELPEQAIRVLQEALDAHGSNPKLLAQLADASLRAGQRDQGLQYVKRSALYAADNPEVQMALAARMAQIGDADDALALLEQMKLNGGRDELKARLLKIALYLRNNQTQKAISEAQNLARNNPDDVQFDRLLARVYLAADNKSKARATLEDALQAAPDNADLHLDLGWLALRGGDYRSANATFQAVLDAHPENVRAMLSMAKSAALQDRTDQAIAWLEKAVALQPENLELAVTLIRAYLSQGRPQDAVPIAESIVTTVPDNARAHRLQAFVLWSADKHEAALTSMKKAVELAPDSLDMRLQLADMLIEQKKFDDAVRELQETRREHPDSVQAAAKLAELQYRQGDIKAALATVDGLRNNPETSASAYALEGDLMRAQSKYKAAAKAYASAYDMQPTRELALRLFEMRLRADLPHPEKSLLTWQRQHPDDLAIMTALAQWHQETGAPETAAETYRAILALEPANALALNNLAMIYFKQGDARALELAKQAYAAVPKSPAIMDTLGWILVNEGNVSQGLPLLRKAAQAAPEQPEMQYHLAVALARSGQSEHRAEARSLLTELLASGARFESRSAAEQLLEQIREKQQQ